MRQRFATMWSWFFPRKTHYQRYATSIPKDVYHAAMSLEIMLKKHPHASLLDTPRQEKQHSIILPKEEDIPPLYRFVAEHIVDDIYHGIQRSQQADEQHDRDFEHLAYDLLTRNMYAEGFDSSTVHDITKIRIGHGITSELSMDHPLPFWFLVKARRIKHLEQHMLSPIIDTAAVMLLAWLSEQGMLCDTVRKLKQHFRQADNFSMFQAYDAYPIDVQYFHEVEIYFTIQTLQHIMFSSFSTAFHEALLDEDLPWGWQKEVLLDRLRYYLRSPQHVELCYELSVEDAVYALKPLYNYREAKEKVHRTVKPPRFYDAQQILRDGYARKW